MKWRPISNQLKWYWMFKKSLITMAKYIWQLLPSCLNFHWSRRSIPSFEIKSFHLPKVSPPFKCFWVPFTYTKKNSREGTHKGLCVGMRRRRDQTHRMSDMVRKSCTRQFFILSCLLRHFGRWDNFGGYFWRWPVTVHAQNVK